jgi:DNA-binding transcriptional ArsR family regulator
VIDRHSQHLDHVFQALSHPVRRQVLKQLAGQERTISELAAPFSMSLEAVSKHVDVLARARLVRRSRSGRSVRCTLVPDALGDAARVLAELGALWNARLDSLERMLSQLEPRTERGPKERG